MMGKLHDLVKFRNDLLEEINSLDLSSNIENKVNILNKIISNNNSINTSNLVNFKNDFNKLVEENQKILDKIKDNINNINQNINDCVSELFFNDTYKTLFSEEHIIQNFYHLPEIETWIESKITQYCDWHYPAIQIRPRSKRWIDNMVVADPLYLTHSDISIIDNMIKEYPEIYRNRLRLYEIIDRDFSILPQAQFSFVLCLDNFNYLSLDKIEKYIREVWLLLRPGGSFIFSYNNCDITEIAYRIECYAGSYASASWLIKLLNEIGYEIITLHDFKTGDAFNTHVSLAEIKKPGELKTVKAHQALAQILIK